MARSVCSSIESRPAPPARRHARAVLLLVALAGLLWASAAAAYVVVLKDGTQIITTKKPEVDGERVILTMRNGTTTFYETEDVDFEETDRINAGSSLEGATLIQDSVIEVDTEDLPQEIDTNLSDVVGGRGLSLPEPKKRQPRTESGPQLPRTAAGYVDLVRVERQPFADAEVSTQVTSYLTGQGHKLSVFEGVSEGAPFLEIQANTESEVFKGIRDTASALVQLGQSFPERVEGFDVLFLTENEIRGGQFSMTLEQAQLITSGRLEPQLFFLRYVEF